MDSEQRSLPSHKRPADARSPYRHPPRAALAGALLLALAAAPRGWAQGDSQQAEDPNLGLFHTTADVAALHSNHGELPGRAARNAIRQAEPTPEQEERYLRELARDLKGSPSPRRPDSASKAAQREGPPATSPSAAPPKGQKKPKGGAVQLGGVFSARVPYFSRSALQGVRSSRL